MASLHNVCACKLHSIGSLWVFSWNVCFLCRIGLDLVNGKPRDNKQAGVFEPTLVKTKSIRFATEAAITILRIDDLIKIIPDEKEGGKSYQDAMQRGELDDWTNKQTAASMQSKRTWLKHSHNLDLIQACISFQRWFAAVPSATNPGLNWVKVYGTAKTLEWLQWHCHCWINPSSCTKSLFHSDVLVISKKEKKSERIHQISGDGNLLNCLVNKKAILLVKCVCCSAVSVSYI